MSVRPIAIAVLAAVVLIEGTDAAMAIEPDANAPPIYRVRDDHFLADVCAIIDREAGLQGLPRAFVVRLIRAESRFRAGAVSPKGAQGIAQFMPGTARLRGLDDAFDAAKALPAAIRYLADLRVRFGNLGAAAAAYNGGEERVEKWLAGDGYLPLETRVYVRRITGRSADEWKDRKDAQGDIAAIGDRPFATSCVEFARGGGPGAEPVVAGNADLRPWGAEVAQGRSRAVVRAHFERVKKHYPEAIGAESPMIFAVRNAAFGRARRLAAAVGADSREAAMDICATIRRAGGYCVVTRTGG